MSAPDWLALGAALKARREYLRLSQADLADLGGPGEITVRKLERGETSSIRAKTKAQLERALGWQDGLVDQILDGAVTTDAELNSHQPIRLGGADRLGDIVRERRRLLRMGQANLAQKSGLSEATIRRIETGVSSPAGLQASTRKALEAALKWPDGQIDRILDGTATEDELKDQADRTADVHTGGAFSALAALPDRAVAGELLARLSRHDPSHEIIHAITAISHLLTTWCTVEAMAPQLDPERR